MDVRADDHRAGTLKSLRARSIFEEHVVVITGAEVLVQRHSPLEKHGLARFQFLLRRCGQVVVVLGFGSTAVA